MHPHTYNKNRAVFYYAVQHHMIQQTMMTSHTVQYFIILCPHCWLARDPIDVKVTRLILHFQSELTHICAK